MLQYLKDYDGEIIVNGIKYRDINQAIEELDKSGYRGELVVQLGGFYNPPEKENKGSNWVSQDIEPDVIYRIKVRQYMTKPSTPQFDFQDKFNNGIPMPMRIMFGKELQHTKGMVKMELWGEVPYEPIDVCMKCGRALTHEVSRYLGIGPECGGHGYNKDLIPEDELKEAMEKTDEDLRKVRWTGWIIKSAIEEQVIDRDEYPEI